MSKTNYPRGLSCEWDLSKFDDELLLHEIELCRQNLYGIWLPEYNTGLKGLMNHTPLEYQVSLEPFEGLW